MWGMNCFTETSSKNEKCCQLTVWFGSVTDFEYDKKINQRCTSLYIRGILASSSPGIKPFITSAVNQSYHPVYKNLNVLQRQFSSSYYT